MVIHSYTGLYSEVTSSQKLAEEVLEIQHYRIANAALLYGTWYIFIGRNTCSIAVIPDHDRRENCRRANVMITYCVNIL